MLEIRFSISYQNSIKTRKMKNFIEEAFLADVSGICWEHMLTGTDDIDVLVSN